MANVTKTELNQQTARVLARVAAGERLTVTDRGRPIAELSPPEKDAWSELVASGQVTLPTKTGALKAPAVKAAKSTREILDDLRADRL
ncbi:prevent-host-death protein [Microbacterium sp. CH12i]|nr:prevent-host-death protein [Microbacterium sp. CH12i]